MKLFELFATLSLQTSDFDSSVEKATKKGEELSSSLEGVIARGTAAGNAMYDFSRSLASGLFNAGRDLVEAAAEVQAENAAFESTFGTLAGAAQEAFGIIGDNTGVLARRLQTVGTKAFAQFKGAGIDANTALLTMGDYLSLAADAAAYYDITLDDADTRLRSFLRGNTEAGDAIGLFTSALQRDEKALEMYGAKWVDLNEAQRQTLMLNIVRQIYAQSDVLGHAAKEADSYQTIMGNVAEAWRQIKATLGGPILEALLPVLQEFEKFLTDNPEAVAALADAIGSIAGATFGALEGVLEYLNLHGDSIATTVQKISKGVREIAQAFGLIPLDELTEGEERRKYGLSYIRNESEARHDRSAWNATGLDYVPYDGFRSTLHRGEMILSASDADALRGGIATGGMDYTRLAGAIASAMAGMTVQMDGQTVGRLVAPTVGREMRREAQSKRYTT